MPAASRPIYKQVSLSNTTPGFLFRKNYTMLAVVFGGAFAFEMTWDNTTDKIWDTINKGRQWKDIRAKYVEAADDE